MKEIKLYIHQSSLVEMIDIFFRFLLVVIAINLAFECVDTYNALAQKGSILADPIYFQVSRIKLLMIIPLAAGASICLRELYKIKRVKVKDGAVEIQDLLRLRKETYAREEIDCIYISRKRFFAPFQIEKTREFGCIALAENEKILEKIILDHRGIQKHILEEIKIKKGGDLGGSLNKWKHIKNKDKFSLPCSNASKALFEGYMPHIVFFGIIGIMILLFMGKPEEAKLFTMAYFCIMLFFVAIFTDTAFAKIELSPVGIRKISFLKKTIEEIEWSAIQTWGVFDKLKEDMYVAPIQIENKDVKNISRRKIKELKIIILPRAVKNEQVQQMLKIYKGASFGQGGGERPLPFFDRTGSFLPGTALRLHRLPQYW